MNKKILQIAKKKFKKLASHYNQFNVVFLDNWRGFRFVYDVEELKKYRGNAFYKSKLYNLLKNEKDGIFTANLYKASKTDKKLYGNNPFLNCKTYREYCNAYTVYLLKKTNSKKQIEDELELIKNMRIIYAKKGDKKKLERRFRRLLVQKVIKFANIYKKKAIINFVKQYPEYF